MPSERVQRQIDRLLDEAEQAVADDKWDLVLQRCRQVLRLDPANADAQALLAAVEREPVAPTQQPGLGSVGARHVVPIQTPSVAPTPAAQPVAFANGRYQVKKFLGEGGKKKVYLAHDTLLDRDVAFALIKTEGLDDAGRVRIQREAQAMGRLGAHPHIVSVFDLGDEEGQPFIVTELMGGGDVEGVIEKAPEHRPPLERTLEIGQQVCRGLEFAHSHGIVHRDLKPGNVWLTADGTAKLGDFGLAVALDRSRLTQAGMMVGTVSYMPPEQAMGGEVTPRSDLYSLGAMLYEMVTGRPPFVGDESVAIITQHLNTPPVSPSWHRPDCPPALETLILRLLEKDAGKRPTSAQEVLEALGSVDLSPRPPSLSGKGEPNETGRTVTSPLTGERPGERSDSPIYRRTFVGREQELRQIQNAFDAAISGQGALVMVVGEPGIGKTALCEQLATYVAVRGGKALVGHSYEEGSLSLPYLPFVEALRSYVLEREPAALKQELASGAGEVARIVSEIREKVLDLGSVGARHVSPEAGSPEDERWRLYQAVTGFLHNAAAAQPLVIVLEDLHWADRGTLDYLLHLSRNLQGTRLLIIGTYRDIEVDRSHPLSAALAELRRASSFSRVVLRGLTVDEVHRMLNALTGQEVRWSLAEAVHRQTEGNPLFIQEVLRYLVEEGLITHEDGRWHRAGDMPPELGIPEGLRDVIGKRLGRLGQECNRVLGVAAVIGRDFRLDVLQQVAGLPEDALETAVEEAAAVGVVEQHASVGAGASFRFTHAFFRQTLYEEIFIPRRIRLHQQVGRALESVYSRRLEEHATELAEHFAQSTETEDLARALRYSELAAGKAMSVYAYAEAARLLEQALKVQEVLDPDGTAKRCDLLLALGGALRPAGEAQRVLDELAPQALDLGESLNDRDRAYRACELALYCLANVGAGAMYATPAWHEWAERAGRFARPGTGQHVHADVWLGLGLRSTGHYEDSWQIVTRAADLARQLGDQEDLLFATGWLIARDGLPQREIERSRLAVELFTVLRENGLSRTLSGLAHRLVLSFVPPVLLGWGRREQAEDLWRDAEEVAARIQEPAEILRSMSTEAQLATVDGRLQEALEIGMRMVARGAELGSPTLGRRWASSTTRRAMLFLGRTEEALAAVPALPNDTPQREQARALVARALIFGLLGQGQEAAAAVQQLRNDLGVGSGADETTTEVLAELLEAAILIEDRDTTALLAGRLRDIAGFCVIGLVYMGPCIARLLGAAAALQGEREQAMTYYEQALEVCEKIRYRPEIALTHLQMAELLLDEINVSAGDPSVGAQGLAPLQTREEALQHLDFAIEEFRAMKMQPALERALKHKEILKA